MASYADNTLRLHQHEFMMKISCTQTNTVYKITSLLWRMHQQTLIASHKRIYHFQHIWGVHRGTMTVCHSWISHASPSMNRSWISGTVRHQCLRILFLSPLYFDVDPLPPSSSVGGEPELQTKPRGCAARIREHEELSPCVSGGFPGRTSLSVSNQRQQLQPNAVPYHPAQHPPETIFSHECSI